MIPVRMSHELGIRPIARFLGRSPGAICDEIRRQGGVSAYLAQAAAIRAAGNRAWSGRKPRMAQSGALFVDVARLLCLGWSPEQISSRRQRMKDGMVEQSGVTVSHEAIYRTIYALPRGELRRELIACLRQDKPARGRKPHGSERRGKLVNMTNSRERPEDVEGRLVPGHWEGDLIVGAGGSSAIGTLVERTSRYVVLVHMPTRKADVVSCAFAGALNAIPQSLRQTLTYDQGKEMASHARLDQQTGTRIFFADPHSPWQRGSNENTNGLLRQYFPCGATICVRKYVKQDEKL
jgi:IS30 family transposase